MNKVFFILILFMLVSCSNKRVGDKRDLISKIDSLEKRLDSVYTPGFGETMGDIQTHHAKLWYGGLNGNWKLAEFEIHEIGELFDNLIKYQSSRKETEYLSLMSPSIKNIIKVIKEKNIEKFKKGFIQLTNSCNECHIKTKYEFVRIIVPRGDQMGNQKY